MTAIALSVTESTAIKALRFFLQAIMQDGMKIFQSQANRVPEPAETNFISITPMGRSRLATNISRYDAQTSIPTGLDVEQSTQLDFQLDIHGPLSADNAQVITTLMRDPYASEQFNEQGLGVSPLYANDPHQIPFINGEAQFENRWVIMISLQVKPILTLPQQYFNQIQIRLIEVDATYPPTAP